MPHYQNIIFKPLGMAKSFAPTMRLLPRANLEGLYGLFSLFVVEELITLLYPIPTNMQRLGIQAKLGENNMTLLPQRLSPFLQS